MAYDLTLTDIRVANQALRMIGEDPIVAFTDVTKRAQLMNEYYATARDAVLMAHHWNFAMRRVSIDAFVEPATTLTLGATSGTAVQLLAGAPLWATADIGKIVKPEVLAGEAEITAIANTTQATGEITSTFSTVGPHVAGEWRLFNDPPDWGLGNHFILPSDFLRLHQMDEDPEHHVEGEVIAADGESINIRYIARISDPTKWPPLFVEAFVAKLAATVAGAISGKGEWMQLAERKYQIALAEAQGYDALEGTRDMIITTPLLDVRE